MKITKNLIEKELTKIYFFNSISLNLKSEVKKIFNIIYQYHIRNKRIVFINVPFFIIKTFKNLKKKIKHFFVPPNVWVNGFITNKSACFYSLLKKKKKSIPFFLNFKTKIDLIVNFDNTNKNFLNITKESCKAVIPTISVNCSENNLLTQTYLITNESILINKKAFFSILKTMLEKEVNLEKNSYIFNKDFYTKKIFKKKPFNKFFFKKKFTNQNYKKKKFSNYQNNINKQNQIRDAITNEWLKK